MNEIVYGPQCMSCGGSLVDKDYYEAFESKYICVTCLMDGTNALIYNFLVSQGKLEGEGEC